MNFKLGSRILDLVNKFQLLSPWFTPILLWFDFVIKRALRTYSLNRVTSLIVKTRRILFSPLWAFSSIPKYFNNMPTIGVLAILYAGDDLGQKSSLDRPGAWGHCCLKLQVRSSNKCWATPTSVDHFINYILNSIEIPTTTK